MTRTAKDTFARDLHARWRCVSTWVGCFLSGCAACFAQVDERPVLRSYSIETLRRATRHVMPPSFGSYPVPPGAGWDSGAVGEGADILTEDALEDDLRDTALPPSWDEDQSTFLRISPRRLLLLACGDVQARVEGRLAAIRDELQALTVAIEIDGYVWHGEDVPVPGIQDEHALATLQASLDSKATRRLFTTRFQATPWDEHVFDRRTHTALVVDIDMEGVGGAPPALDPVVYRVSTGPFVLVRQTPLEYDGWVHLHLDLRYSALLDLRHVNAAGDEEAHIDLADVALEGVTQDLCVPRGGGVVFVNRVRRGETRVFVVRVSGQDADHGEPVREETFLKVGALTSPLGVLAGLPLDRFHWIAEEDDEPRRRLETEDALRLFARHEVDQDISDDAPWISMSKLTATARNEVRAAWVELERTQLRTAHVELEVVESESLDEPADVASRPTVGSTTLLALPRNTSRAAIGRCVSFLGDWDVEVSQGLFPTDPVLEQEFLGTWVHLTPHVVEPDHGTFHLELFAHACAGETRTVTPTKDLEPIELPVTAKTVVARDLELRVGQRVWLGRVPGGRGGRVRHAFLRLVEVTEIGP